MAESSIADCDRALVVLLAAVADLALKRELIVLSMDRLLDRRLELMEGSRMGAQS